MDAIRATVRNGKLETPEPVDLPDGTELVFVPADRSQTHDEIDGVWDDSPEGIEAWIAQLHSLRPLIFTAEERAEWEKAKREQREWELAHFDERAEKLRRMWE